jgi:L-asparagine transporter-like permease
LPFEKIQGAGRVATDTMNVIFSGRGAIVMAVAIMISTFGCNNGLILAGARAYYAMARDGLFFKSSGQLNDKHVPAWSMVIQGIWAALLVLPRTIKRDAVGAITGYGNLYGNLLDYVISAALIFYILTILGIIVLRYKRPNAERPYKAFRLSGRTCSLYHRRCCDPGSPVHLSNSDDLAGADNRHHRHSGLFHLEKSRNADGRRRIDVRGCGQGAGRLLVFM